MKVNVIELVKVKSARGISLALCCALAWSAGGETNVWTSTSGGDWTNTANWASPQLLGEAFFADFSAITDSEAEISVPDNTKVLGLRFAPAVVAEGATNACRFVCDTSSTISAFFSFYATNGIQPEIVVSTNATVHIAGHIGGGNATYVDCSGGGRIEIAGNGNGADATLWAHDVCLAPQTQHSMNEVSLRMFPEAVLDLSSDVYLRWFMLNDENSFNPILLNGHVFSHTRGSYDFSIDVDLFANAGTLCSKSGHTVTLTANQSAALNYRLADGDIAFDAPYVPLVACLFDDADNIGKNDGSLADLVTGAGTPVLETDATRGSVLYLDGSTKLIGSENGNLSGLPTGSGDYTIALWLKMASGNPKKGGILFWGTWNKGAQSTVFRCAQDKATGNFMYSHYGSDFQVTQATDAFDGEWHHVAIVRESGTETFYLDGAAVESKTLTADIKEGSFNLGYGQSAYFNGWIDNLVIVPRAVPAGRIAKLQTAEGIAEGIAEAGVIASPNAQAVVEVEDTGTLWLNGAQTLGALAGNGMAGAVNMDGDMTLGGLGYTTNTVYHADITGTGALVKCGSDYGLTLSGTASYTGSTRVAEGRLAVRSATPVTRQASGLVAEWLFEDPNEPGRDTSGNGFSLAVTGEASDATVVEDATRGKVLAVDSTTGSRFMSGSTYPVTFPNGDAAYSVSLWFKTADDTPANAVLCYWGDCTGDMHSHASVIRLDGTSGLVFSTWGNNHSTNDRNYHDGAWHHVVAVYTGGTSGERHFYVDGTRLANGSNVTLSIDTDGYPFYLAGRMRGGNNISFKGWLDDVRFYSFAMTDDEAAAEYEGSSILTHNGVVEITPESLPTPVVKFTFEDSDSPYASSGGTADMALEAVGDVSVTNDDQRAGKVLCLPSSGMNYLQATTIPDALPAGSESITISLWASPATLELGKGPDGSECMFYYGDPTKSGKFHLFGNNGRFLRYTLSGDKYMLHSPRNYTAARRWHHYVLVYDSSNGNAVDCYIDGVQVADSSAGSVDIVPRFFYIGRKTSSSTVSFKGMIDDVAVYDTAFTAEQAALLYREESGKDYSAVLPGDTDVSVSSGAVFAVEDSTDLSVRSLSGAGEVDLSGASTLTLSAVTAGEFTGTWSGAGEVALAEGAVVSVDGAGTGLPALTAPGVLTLPAAGTLAISGTASSVQPGTYVLATGASVTAPDGLDGWTCTVDGSASEVVKAEFSVSDGAFKVRLGKSGFMLIVR